MSAEQNDAVLVNDVAAGRRASYLALCRRYSRKLANLVYWWLGDWQTSESTVYDILFGKFCQLVDGRHEQSDQPFRIEILSMTVREAARRLREQRGMPPPTEETFFEDEGAVLSEIIEGEGRKPPTALAERHRANHVVEESLLRMKGDQRLTLLLRDYWGLSYSEISLVMGRPVEDVRQWLFRARRRMGTLSSHRSDRIKDNRDVV
ncbi:MAG: RNA polymerase sigma factor [Candidatus Hydrogenedentes bacterium]|nr:RNA polymerase sigma factor [Candidatus Hydrogenedentota bacterium]